MCLAIPGKIEQFEDGKTYAIANFDGIKKKVITAMVPAAEIGSYVVVHAGMAISILDEAEALESLKGWHEILESDPSVKREDYL